RSVIHPTLPPSPTRRSSDLVEHAEAQKAGQLDMFGLAIQPMAVVVGLRERNRRHSHFGPLGVDCPQADLVERNRVGREIHRLVLDRKSTRLNSSHVAISYAV